MVVKSLDRLSRSKKDVSDELRYYADRQIRVKILDLPTTTIDFPVGQEWILSMVNNILIEVLATIAEQERQTIRTRQAEGIAAAKKAGKHLGRPALSLPENWETVYEAWTSGKITAKHAMEMTGLKRTSFYKTAADSKTRSGD